MRFGDTERLSWIHYELWGNWEKLNQRYAAKRAMPQQGTFCLSAKWLGPNARLGATAPQMPKLHRDGRDCPSVIGGKKSTSDSLQHSSPQKKCGNNSPQIALCSPVEFFRFCKDVVQPRLGFSFCICSPARCILWCLELGCFSISWGRKSPSTYLLLLFWKKLTKLK